MIWNAHTSPGQWSKLKPGDLIAFDIGGDVPKGEACWRQGVISRKRQSRSTSKPTTPSTSKAHHHVMDFVSGEAHLPLHPSTHYIVVPAGQLVKITKGTWLRAARVFNNSLAQ